MKPEPNIYKCPCGRSAYPGSAMCVVCSMGGLAMEARSLADRTQAMYLKIKFQEKTREKKR